MTTDTIGGVWSYADGNLFAALRTPRSGGGAGPPWGARLNTAQTREIHSFPNLEVFETDYKLEWMKDPWQGRDVGGRMVAGSGSAQGSRM